SGNGSLQVGGIIRLMELSKPVTDLTFNAQNFRAIDVPNFFRIEASADLTMQGPVLGATLRGHGTITSGVVYFADIINKQIVNLEDTLYADVMLPQDTLLIRR